MHAQNIPRSPYIAVGINSNLHYRTKAPVGRNLFRQHSLAYSDCSYPQGNSREHAQNIPRSPNIAVGINSNLHYRTKAPVGRNLFRQHSLAYSDCSYPQGNSRERAQNILRSPSIAVGINSNLHYRIKAPVGRNLFRQHSLAYSDCSYLKEIPACTLKISA